MKDFDHGDGQVGVLGLRTWLWRWKQPARQWVRLVCRPKLLPPQSRVVHGTREDSSPSDGLPPCPICHGAEPVAVPGVDVVADWRGMMPRMLCALLLVGVCVGDGLLAAAADPIRSEDPAAGVKLTLVAEHPQLATLTGIDVDAQGTYLAVATTRISDQTTMKGRSTRGSDLQRQGFGDGNCRDARDLLQRDGCDDGPNQRRRLGVLVDAAAFCGFAIPTETARRTSKRISPCWKPRLIIRTTGLKVWPGIRTDR